jgi:hypothetical protein
MALDLDQHEDDVEVNTKQNVAERSSGKEHGKSIGEVWEELKDETTAHGISKLRHDNTRIKRRAWMVILSCSLCVLAYHLYTVIKAYLAYNVNVSIDLVTNQAMIFPAVTVCNANPIRVAALDAALAAPGDGSDMEILRELSLLGYGVPFRYKRTISNQLHSMNNMSVAENGAVAEWFKVRNSVLVNVIYTSASKEGEGVHKGDTSIPKVDASVPMEDTSVNNEDSSVSRGDSIVRNGDSRVSKGDSSVSRGDSIVRNGDSSVSKGDSSVSVGDTVSVSKRDAPRTTRDTARLATDQASFADTDRLLYLTAQLPEELKQQLGHQARRMLFNCQYDGHACDVQADFVPFYNDLLGNCFTFNSNWRSGNVRSGTKTGRRFGLHVSLNIKQKAYLISGEQASTHQYIDRQVHMNI